MEEMKHEQGDSVHVCACGETFTENFCFACGRQAEEVTYSAEADFWYVEDVLKRGVVIGGYDGHDGEVVIPPTLDGKRVFAIGSEAFANRVDIISVIIPEGVTYIDEHAFLSCKGLERVTLPKGLISIEAGAFANCYSLLSVTIPDSVEQVSPTAFFGCKAEIK